MLKHPENMAPGLESAPDASIRMLQGGNLRKERVQVSGLGRVSRVYSGTRRYDGSTLVSVNRTSFAS
jgi:hypothetical protein